MEKFSVLIAHYNNYEYFIECYESLLAQTYQNFEIILVDDCSTDQSFEKIKILTENDPKIRLFRNDQNKGVGYTKRKCAEMASGNICGFLDPDDALAENAIEISIKNHNSGNVATYSQFFLCDSHLKRLKLFQHSRPVKNADPKFFNVFLEVNHFFTFKKSAYDKTLGINPELSSAEDQDLYLKMYDQGNLSFIREPLYFYRLHEKGVSQEKSKKKKLHENWQKMILDTAKRRNISHLYGKNIEEITNLHEFVFQKQNTIFAKIRRKLM